MAEKGWIPEVSDETLNQLATQIKVIVNREGDRYYIKPVGMRKEFFYDPDLDKLVGESELLPIQDIITYHPILSRYMFQPRLVDILAQIPEKLYDQVIAIELVEYPETYIQVGRNLKEYHAGYYVAMTRLYSKAF